VCVVQKEQEQKTKSTLQSQKACRKGFAAGIISGKSKEKKNLSPKWLQIFWTS
jgi:hypothetical protein